MFIDNIPIWLGTVEIVKVKGIYFNQVVETAYIEKKIVPKYDSFRVGTVT